MKTELQIAKENIEMFKRHNWKSEVLVKRILIEHKQTCGRWLEFLEGGYIILDEMTLGITDKLHSVRSNIRKKRTDLKDAIKLYEDNGI